MDKEKLEKLARTFKENGFASNMDEAMKFAKSVLAGAGGELKTSEGLQKEVEDLKHEEEEIEQQESEVHKQIESLKKELDEEEAELEALNKEIQALQHAKLDAKEVLKDEKRDAKVDNLAEEDLD